MQTYEQNGSQVQQNNQEANIYSFPLPVRFKHASWSVRKVNYQQILYLLKDLPNPNEQIVISGNAYTIQTLLPYFQNLIQEKHAVVLLKGLQCVEQILKIDKKAYTKHCIKSLADKGIEYFPLLSQQRKAILQKFLDILQLSKIDANFLKNKLNLPHQKSVMYVIQVIGVLSVTSLKNALFNLSKKHQKKCVRQLALEIAEELSQQEDQNNENKDKQENNNKNPNSQANKNTKNTQNNSSSKITIQKLPHYEQLSSKEQQQYSSQLLEKIDEIIDQYCLSQLPNFSHFIRLMVDDNNHIINTNAIKCLIAIFSKQKEESSGKGSLIPVSFPLLFIFNKFKSHKTHPINALLLNLAESILQSTNNRINDLFLAINEGLSSMGSKANVKFGSALTFFRIISLIHKNQDLYICTTNQNIENQNEDLQQKFSRFDGIVIGKNLQKTIEKIMISLQKQKKYQTQIYLIKHAIGMDNNLVPSSSGKQLIVKPGKTVPPKNNNYMKGHNSQKQLQQKKSPKKLSFSHSNTHVSSDKKLQNSTNKNQKTGSLSKTLKNSKSSNKFQQINLQQTLNQISKLVNQHNEYQQRKPNFQLLNKLIEKSSEEFYQSVKQKRYEMFYLCELLQNFIEKYQPNDHTIQHVSEFLVNILKIISLLKLMNLPNQKAESGVIKQFRQLNINNVSQILLVTLCKLVIGEEIQQILQNLSQNYDFQTLLLSLQNLFVRNTQNKIKKKNKKFLIDWLQGNTPALYLNNEYYKLLQKIKQKDVKNKINPKSEMPIKGQQKEQLSHRVKLEKFPFDNSSGKKYNSNQDYIDIYSNKKQKRFAEELQNINLSKIQKNGIQSNYYEDDLEKSSFHQNLEQHLKQIQTYRSGEDQKSQNNDLSRQYLQKMKIQNFKKNKEQSPFRLNYFKDNEGKDQENQGNEQDESEQRQLSPYKQKSYKLEQNQRNQSKNLNNSVNYEDKFSEVQNRRIQRERQRKQFMNRMKHQFKPMENRQKDHSSQESDQQEKQSSQSQVQQYPQKGISKTTECYKNNQSYLSNQESIEQFYLRKKENQSPKQSTKKFLQNNSGQSLQQGKSIEGNFFKLQSRKQSQKLQIPQFIKTQIAKNVVLDEMTGKKSIPGESMIENSFVSSNQSGEFKYRLLNSQKIIYMLKTTNNPYPHLRTLILIPFKSSQKKHQFLKELLHFYSNQIKFQIPQPYNSLVLLTILLFSEIKQDKTLIQPLQALYEFIAKQSSTNQFVKTIINLFHSVIEQTLPLNRKFLITILLKSMIRMLPFIQDALSLLRDIQQFYQIGQMVYFEMFQQEYTQIKNYIQEEAIHIIVQKALQQEGDNLISIVEGWLTTGFKTRVLQAIHQFTQEDGSHEDLENNHEQAHKYNSYI